MHVKLADAAHHAPLPPSDWVLRWQHLLPARATVLDLACGRGRHVRALAEQGHRLTAVDRDAAALEPLRACAEVVVADLEIGPWPLQGRRFDGIVVTHYLWRPLWPQLCEALAPGGVLIYETFASGNERYGKPSSPQFLLRPGELLQALAPLRILAYEDGVLPEPLRCMQRAVATRDEPASAAVEGRHRLAAAGTRVAPPKAPGPGP